MSNQCQGCQAGWNVEDYKLGSESDHNIKFHLVAGGYKGEKVVCTKSKYEAPQPTKTLDRE